MRIFIYYISYLILTAQACKQTLPSSDSTRSTLLKVDKVDRVALAPSTLATKSTLSRTELNVSATKSTATRCRIHVVAGLLPVSATVDFQQSRPCLIQLCRQCVPGLRLRDRCADNTIQYNIKKTYKAPYVTKKVIRRRWGGTWLGNIGNAKKMTFKFTLKNANRATVSNVIR